ncbi:tetratricopeptide repeat protein 6 [Gastrophryne carolinensis]
MSYGQEHLHFRLNYAEELGIKKELEELLKPSQKTVNQNHVGFRSNSPLSLMQGPSLSQFSQLNLVSRPRSKVMGKLAQPTCQSPTVAADSVCKNSEKEHPIPASLSKNAMTSSKNQKQLQNARSAKPKDLEEIHQRVKRPAISSVCGTTKPISVFNRPKPPIKFRSNLPQSCIKLHTSEKPTKTQKRVKQISRVAQAPLTKKRTASDERSTEDSTDSNCSSSSDSPDSDDSNKRTRNRRRKKKVLAMKTDMLAIPDKDINDAHNENTAARLTEELAKVAEASPMLVTSERGNYQETAEKTRTSYPPLLPLKTTARSVDEIIASLRSPQTQTASDLMIKQLMESVWGLDYNMTYKQSFPYASSPDANKLFAESSLFLEKEEEQTFQEAAISTPVENMTLPLEKQMTKEEAKQVLKSSAQITISDIIHVKGDGATLTRRETAMKTHPPVTLLATWKPRNKSGEHQTIHHLCTVSPSHVLPASLWLTSQVLHTVDRKGHHVNLDLNALPKNDATTKDILGNLKNGVPTSTLPSNNQKGGLVIRPFSSAKSLEEWQRIAEYYVEGPHMELFGEQAYLNPGTLKMFWTSAPPKFSAPLSFVQNTLFSKYESCVDEQEQPNEFLMMEAESRLSEEDNVDLKDQAQLVRVLSRRHTSLQDISFSSSSAPVFKKKRSLSAPDVSVCGKCKFNLSADFYTSMKEIAVWTQLHYSSLEPEIVPSLVTEEETKAEKLDPISDITLKTTLLAGKEKDITSIEKGMNPNIIFKRKKKKPKQKKGRLDPEKLKTILQELKHVPSTLTRSVSFVGLSSGFHSTNLLRRSSLPCCLDFSTFLRQHDDSYAEENTREWVRNIWNHWFDEVFPPSRASLEDEEPYYEIINTGHPDPITKENISWAADLDSIPPFIVEDHSASLQDVEREISQLTYLIETQETQSAFHYCRRGALNRKIGNLHLALQDLEMVIKHEPQLLDAYWHRHLIYLLQGKFNKALDDLNFIIKYNKKNADAYLSKAEIYKQKKDYTLAIVNYSQALKCRPADDEIYFRRAQMYELQNELRIAMDDYAQCFFHNPSRTDALMKHGFHYFEKSNWNGAVQDFSAVIKQDFTNVEARTYRGRAYTKLSFYTEAAEDFSAVIHLDPKNWMAFYYRGCLLRKCYPYHALQDFSISVLLYDGFENLYAFLHRGILYTDLGLWSEAAYDFEQVLGLDRTMSVAHVNLGLICLLHRGQYSQAIHHFSEALKVDPMNIRAYLCRAQAYRQQQDLKNALKDITRAIHMRPDFPEPYIIRGQYLYEMKRYDLASFCIHHAAEMTQGRSPVQQALVQSFRRQYNNAIECLVSANKERSAPGQLILLGKIQMKAKKNKDAAESFIRTLELLGHTPERSSASERAEVFYLLGLCYMEQFKFIQALDALTSSIKVRPGFCDAYYQRGLCRMCLQQASCVQDFNKALEINPNYFQAYLCRATFYGFKKRYSKAIMNCNAAIKVQPHSVRAYLYRGALKYYIKAYKLAVVDLSKAIELDPSCALAYYNRGVCYHQMKMYKEALKDYAIVLLLGGWKEVDVKVLVNRGLLYLELHDYANALENFKAVIMKTPRDVKIHQVIGDCYYRLQQYEEAVEACSQVLRLNPLSPEGHVGRGNAYMEYGHEEGRKCAQADFVRALHLDPTCIDARICLGYNLQAQGFYQKAWNQFTINLDINPRSILSFEGRAIVNLQMGNTFAAIQDMNAAIKLGVTAQLLTNRGVIHQFMGKLPNAMKDYQSAIAANPKYALAFFNAANLYLHNRQFSQAIDYYSEAIALDPSNESAVLNRGISRMLLKDVQGALQDFQTVLNLCPEFCAAYFNRASLHNTLQQYQHAHDDISQALILQPGDPLMYKLRADIRGKMGLAEEAIEDYKQAINLLQQETSGPASN